MHQRYIDEDLTLVSLGKIYGHRSDMISLFFKRYNLPIVYKHKPATKINERFGLLTVVGFNGTTKAGDKILVFRCDCGFEFSRAQGDFRRTPAEKCKLHDYRIRDGKKWCSRCDQIKPVDDFYKEERGLEGYNSLCKKCVGKDARSTNLRHPEAQRIRRKRRKAKIRSLEWKLPRNYMDILIEVCEGKCLDCGEN